MLYRLKCGAHNDGRRHYEEGSLVESPLDLAALYPEKFEEVSRRPNAIQGRAPTQSDGAALEDLTTEELRMLAKEERIDVSNVTERVELVRVIRAMLES